MSDVNPIQNNVQPTDTPVKQTQQVVEDAPASEEIDNTEVDSGQNVDTFA